MAQVLISSDEEASLDGRETEFVRSDDDGDSSQGEDQHERGCTLARRRGRGSGRGRLWRPERSEGATRS